MEFHLSIANDGLRPSQINKFSLKLGPLDKTFDNYPNYFSQWIRSIRGVQVRNEKDFFPAGEFIRVSAESITGPKYLAFELTGDLPWDHLGKSEYVGNRLTMRFEPIECRLTIMDDQDASTYHDFTLKPI